MDINLRSGKKSQASARWHIHALQRPFGQYHTVPKLKIVRIIASTPSTSLHTSQFMILLCMCVCVMWMRFFSAARPLLVPMPFLVVFIFLLSTERIWRRETICCWCYCGYSPSYKWKTLFRCSKLNFFPIRWMKVFDVSARERERCTNAIKIDYIALAVSLLFACQLPLPRNKLIAGKWKIIAMACIGMQKLI